jgi:hypothetical protein
VIAKCARAAALNMPVAHAISRCSIDFCTAAIYLWGVAERGRSQDFSRRTGRQAEFADP